MIKINPVKILLKGDINKAEKFISVAKSQLEILKQDMNFNNLTQGVRRVQLFKDVYIECIKCFNLESCKIITVSEKALESFVFSNLIIVVSLADETQAVAWDIINDRRVFNIDSLDNIKDQLDRTGFSVPNQLTYMSYWEENRPSFGATNQDGNIPDAILGLTWALVNNENVNSIAPYNENIEDWNFDAVLELINTPGESASTEFFGAYFKLDAGAFYSLGTDWEVGDYITFDTIKGSDAITNIVNNGSGALNTSMFSGDILGAITESWTITITEAPPGYASNILNIYISGATVGGVYDSGVGVKAQMAWEDNNKGDNYIPWEVPLSYFKYIESPEYDTQYAAYAFRKDDGFAKEFWQNYFETSSGYSWPTGMDYIIREAVFYNPLFGPDFTDLIPYSAQMKAVTTNLYDSFLSGDWSGPALIEDSEGIITEDQYDIAKNRVDLWNTLGSGYSYVPEDEEDNTEIVAMVVFDAFYFNSYVGTNTSTQFGINIQYRLYDILTGSTQTIFDLINIERDSEGLDSLKQNHILQIAAQRHANDMALNKMDSHTGSDDSNYYSRAEDAGYFINRPKPYCFCGENIAKVDMNFFTFADVVAAWMASPGHRENILFENFTDTGIAVSTGSDGLLYICQIFGGKPGAWAGFGSFNTEKLNAYIYNNFSFNSSMDDDFLKVYVSQRLREN